MTRSMDFSGNQLSDAFPDSVEILKTSLQSLNLSYNHFNVSIPKALFLVSRLTYVHFTAVSAGFGLTMTSRNVV